jgi:hypothetical protein
MTYNVKPTKTYLKWLHIVDEGGFLGPGFNVSPGKYVWAFYFNVSREKTVFRLKLYVHIRDTQARKLRVSFVPEILKRKRFDPVYGWEWEQK